MNVIDPPLTDLTNSGTDSMTVVDFKLKIDAIAESGGPVSK